MGAKWCCCCQNDVIHISKENVIMTPSSTSSSNNTLNALNNSEIPFPLLNAIQTLTKLHHPEKIGQPKIVPNAPKYKRLSKPVSQLIGPNPPAYDVVIVGSGYGGGVLGSRLSRAGKKVCILERGKERWPGEYPNTFKDLLPNVQVRSEIAELGPKDAFFDIRLEDGAYIWIGCGLGGGSLVNSGVSIQPDPRVFDQDCWPKEIQKDRDTKLKDGFQKAQEMLRPAQYPNQASKPLPRVERFKEAAAHLRENGYPQANASLATVNVSFKTEAPNKQGVEQPACTLCGDCNTGCNVGAKNTVLMNYLPDAVNHGADIYTGVEARYVNASDGNGWSLQCQLTDPSFNPPFSFNINSKFLILCAGTLGTAEILLRSRKRGLSMSPQVGLSFGADGDFFRPSFNGESKTNTLGYGNDPNGERRKAEDDTVGPCITSVLDLRDPKKDVTEGIILEDIGIGGALVPPSNLIFSKLASVLGQPTEKDPAKLAQAKIRAKNSAKNAWAKDGALVNSICWGGMSFDDQKGSLKLENDALRLKWTTASEGPNPPARSDALAKACCETPTIKSVFCTDPLESLLGERGTIHPLGGCCLADDATKGGCNHKGQLFADETGTRVHEGFYVCDGSVVPSSLGVNPLWTISAIAERCSVIMAEDYGWNIDSTEKELAIKSNISDNTNDKKSSLDW